MRKLRKWAFRIFLCPILALVGSSVFLVEVYRFIPPQITPLMVVRLLEGPVKGQTHRLFKDWVPLRKISPNLQLAVIASEDNRFLDHFGFDLDAIEKARKFNSRQKGRRFHGASTITQQTAKNVFLWPHRSWVRKALEVYFTFLIEWDWSKRRIMEVYLNVIEMGKGIYGAEAASLAYFGKTAAELSRGESAMLAAILPNPRRWNPTRPTAYLLERRRRILATMDDIGRVEY